MLFRSERSEQAAQWQAQRAEAERTLAAAQHDHDALMAAFAQAERAQSLAQAACADSVESLRATLEDDSPCPVCGAHEHPYRHEDGALHALLAELQQDVIGCRQRLQDNVANQAAQRTTTQTCIARLGALAAEQHGADAAIAQLAQAWAAHPLAAEAQQHGGDGDLRTRWFAAELEAASAALAHCAEQEQALRRAGQQRDSAQLAYDEAAQAHGRQQALAATAQAALADFDAQHKALDDKRLDVALQLGALLDELDGAFGGGDGADAHSNEGWKDEWKAGPHRFHEARAAETRQWLLHAKQQETRAAQLATLSVEVRALTDAQARTEHDALQARTALASADSGLQAMQQQRMALWGGKEVHDVEAQLQGAVDGARAALAAQQQASGQAAQALVRADEAAANATRRRAQLQTAAQAAADALAAWLAAFRARGAATPDDEQLASVEQLMALLACPVDDIAAERSALQALAQAVAEAAAVLHERRTQRAAHALAAPTSGDGSADTPDGHDEDDEHAHAGAIAALTEALAALAAERRAAHDTAAAHQVGIATDNEKRRKASAMLGEIERQEAVEQRWGRMNELIGSADGKLFRNYAQQFTLEVLLGYANAHLGHLARRYRLERINNQQNPSLGLLVRDQDMGGDMRSVHSLSGGEAFLVSLALALGLASLSSNRVRVESLFIDEGFGSLDAETLRVAMDALDGLQAMGRKVGVISHVQEMTERISTRIVVRPTAGGKSVVLVE